jgi:TonB family protein
MSVPFFRAVLLAVSVLTTQASASGLPNRQQSTAPARETRQVESIDDKAVKRVDPVYPDLAKRARISGIVVVEVTVDHNGEVIAARAISGHPLLRDAAVAAARLWKFQPSAKEGAQTIGRVTLSFKYESDSDDDEVERARLAVKTNPRSAQAHRDLGKAYSNADQEQEALAEFEEALRLSPDDLETLKLLAESYSENNRADDAIATLKKAVAVSPDDQFVLGRLVQLFAQRQLYFDAMETQKRLCELQPTNGNSLINLGYYSMMAQANDKAIEAYKKAGELMPKSALPFHGLGAAYLATGRYQESIDAFRLALTNDQNYRQAFRVQYEIGRAQMALHRLDDAIQAFEKAVSLNAAFPEAFVAIAGVHHDRSAYDEAERWLKRALAVSPRYLFAHYAIGDIYLHEGDLEAGEKAFREALKLGAENTQARFGLAASLLLQKKTAEADAAIAEALRTRVSGTMGYIILGSLLTHLGDDSAAELIYRRAYAMDPNNHLLLNNLGYLMVDRGENLDEAFKMIQRAVNVQPTNAAYLDSLGWAYFKLGKLDDAERYLLDATRNDKNSPTIREHLGDVYQKLSKMAMAKGAWEQALSLATERAQVERLKGKIAGESKK